MADKSLIEWTDATWNPITGCSVVSPGCTNCYAMKLAGTRLRHHPTRAGLTRESKAGPVWTGEVRFNERQLLEPLGWKKPRMIFVCAHGDLFHEGVPDSWIDRIFAVMALCPQHTFQVLTKRPERMREYLGEMRDGRRVYELACDMVLERQLQVVLIAHPSHEQHAPPGPRVHLGVWPLANVWLGTSVEDQRRADERIPYLLNTPAAVRFLSAEPLLGRIDLGGVMAGGGVVLHALKGTRHDVFDETYGEKTEQYAKLDWVIVGGESGPGARPMHPDWARSLRDQCAAAGVPFFFKQWGNWIDADSWYEKISRDGIQMLIDGRLWQPLQPLNFQQAQLLADTRGSRYERHSDGTTLIHVGKATAGRLLDGIEHNGFPQVGR